MKTNYEYSDIILIKLYIILVYIFLYKTLKKLFLMNMILIRNVLIIISDLFLYIQYSIFFSYMLIVLIQL